MASLRVRIGLVALGVLVPVGLLVWRALGSVEVERRARHQVVAERLFDEMERALSDLLGPEEARPFEGYAEGGADGPGVLGRFQVDPDGTVRAPAPARPFVEALWRAPAPAEPAQRPGSTLALGKEAAGAPAAGDEKKAREGLSAYDALRSLNLAAEQRTERRKQQADEQLAGAKTQLEADAGVAGRSGGPPGALRDAEAPGALEPMTGRLVDPRHLVLSRTVVRTGRAWRQGVVVDVARLGDWLRERALGTSPLAGYASVVVGPVADAAPSDGTAFAYRHRFAEPFAALGAKLTLAPLPGSGGAAYVYALSALLLVALAAGLGALYRTVAVAVGFAQRRSDFVAAVSHELKTPLTAIRMYGEMLRDGLVASEAKRDQYHRHITAESERLSRLIDNVLEFSRLEKRVRPVALVVGPVTPVLEEAAALLAPHLEGAGLRLRLAIEPGLPPARFERDALLQVLVNAVDNAVKYAAGGVPGEVVLAARREGGRLVVAVRDHGPGVPAAQLGRIFEPFYRGERELTRRSKGTGLGLALVRGLGEAMGATVLGRNLPDGGFEVAIALAAAADAAG